MDKFNVNRFIQPNEPSNPTYQSTADFTTNAPSYYAELARKQGLIQELATRVWEYDQLLAEKLLEVQNTLQRYSDILDGKIDNFDNIILEKTQKWLDENMEHIMTKAVKMVWFGLSDEGYFMAMIPSNWSEVQFDTTEDGRLILTT